MRKVSGAATKLKGKYGKLNGRNYCLFTVCEYLFILLGRRRLKNERKRAYG